LSLVFVITMDISGSKSGNGTYDII